MSGAWKPWWANVIICQNLARHLWAEFSLLNLGLGELLKGEKTRTYIAGWAEFAGMLAMPVGQCWWQGLPLVRKMNRCLFLHKLWGQTEHVQILLDNLKTPDFFLLWALPSQSSLSCSGSQINGLCRVGNHHGTSSASLCLPLASSPERGRGGGSAQSYFAALLTMSLQPVSSLSWASACNTRERKLSSWASVT